MRAIFLLLGMIVFSGEAVAIQITYRSADKTVDSFQDDKGTVPGPRVPPASFPLVVKEESTDGAYYRVEYAGSHIWIPKRKVKSVDSIPDLKERCMTVDPSAINNVNGTRSANEGCVPDGD